MKHANGADLFRAAYAKYMKAKANNDVWLCDYPKGPPRGLDYGLSAAMEKWVVDAVEREMKA